MPRVRLDIEANLTEVNQAGVAMQKLGNEATELGRDMNSSFRTATKAADAFDTEVKEGTKDMDRLGKTSRAVTPQMADGFRKTTTEVKKANTEASKFNEKMADISTGIAAAFSVGAVIGFGKRIIETRAEFQKFEAVLTNTLGSKSLAQSALTMIQDVAAKTPFSVQELTASFVKLANQGFQPTSKEIVKLGDLAASQGKSFDQLTEGIIDAQTGEFERLKEFGIRASKEGNNVKFTFKGVETQVKNNSKAIQQYVLGLGELQGVAGGMAAISDTLGGKISNLGDGFDAFFNNLGQNTEGVFGSVLDSFNEFLGMANQAQSVLNQTNKVLKDAGQETSFLDDLFGAQLDLVPLQQALNLITGLGAEAKKTSDFIPAYQKLKEKLAEITAQYKAGDVSAEQFNRQVALIANAQKALDEQSKALIEKDKKSREADAAAKTKEAQDEAKKTKALREAFEKEKLDLAKKALKAEIDQLDDNSEEKITKEKEVALKEIEELKKSFIQKGKLIDGDGKAHNAAFKLTAEQEAQFRILRQQADAEANEKIIELRKKQAAKELEIAKKSINDEIALSKLKSDLQTTKVEGVTSPKGATKFQEAQLEAAKQAAILKIKRDAAIEALDIKERQLEMEADAEIAANPAMAEAIRARLDAQKEILFEETKNLVSDVNKELENLEAGQKKFSFAKLLGLTEEEFSKVSQGVNQLINNVGDIITTSIEAQQALLDNELQMNEERKDARSQNIDDLQAQLERELELQRQGLANNVDSIKEAIAAEQAAKAADIENERKIKEEKKKLAKQQFAIDTAVQAVNLITASTEIFKTYAGIPFIGIPLAIALIATMAGAFVASKVKTLQAINQGQGFKDGVIDLKGPGSETSDSIPAHLSKGESVMTAKETRDNKDLLLGIRHGDIDLMGKGMYRLWKEKGVELPVDLPRTMIRNRDFIKGYESEASKSDFTGMEKRLVQLTGEVVGLRKQLNEKRSVLADGTVIITKGSLTRIIKGKG